MDSSWDAFLKISALLVPLLWHEVRLQRLRKRSGKRIRYMLWKEGQASIVNPRLRRWWNFATHQRESLSPVSCEAKTYTAQMFLWNGGSEEIVAADFFRERPLFIDLVNGEFLSYRVILETDDFIASGSELATRTRGHPLRSQSDKVVLLRIDHWPPGAGLVVELKYQAPSSRSAAFVLSGPVRGLRERRYLGNLWQIELTKPQQLARELTTSQVLTWIGGIGMLVSGAVLVMHVNSWPVNGWQYWLAMMVAVFFEWIFLTWKEKRIQLSKKVAPSLIYWLKQPYAGEQHASS